MEKGPIICQGWCKNSELIIFFFSFSFSFFLFSLPFPSPFSLLFLFLSLSLFFSPQFWPFIKGGVQWKLKNLDSINLSYKSDKKSRCFIMAGLLGWFSPLYIFQWMWGEKKYSQLQTTRQQSVFLNHHPWTHSTKSLQSTGCKSLL